MNINWGGDSVVAKSLAHHGSDGKVGDVVVVHNIKVNNVGSGLKHVVDFFAELSKVGRKDGWSDEVVFVSPYVQLGGCTGRCLQK